VQKRVFGGAPAARNSREWRRSKVTSHAIGSIRTIKASASGLPPNLFKLVPILFKLAPHPLKRLSPRPRVRSQQERKQVGLPPILTKHPSSSSRPWYCSFKDASKVKKKVKEKKPAGEKVNRTTANIDEAVVIVVSPKEFKTNSILLWQAQRQRPNAELTAKGKAKVGEKQREQPYSVPLRCRGILFIAGEQVKGLENPM
jgi:hypothetical protein